MAKFSDLVTSDPKWLEVFSRHYFDYFSYHARQRLDTIRYFLAAYAIFVAAYSSLLSDGAEIAALVAAIVVFFLTCMFRRLDLRNEQLIHNAEAPLGVLQKRLEEIDGCGEVFNLIARGDETRVGGVTYGSVLPSMFLLLTGLAAAGVIAAAYLEWGEKLGLAAGLGTMALMVADRASIPRRKPR